MVPIFASYDGTELGYQVLGDGPPVVCLPGGPGRASTYLGDLGGLDASRQLNLLDLRGVGRSGDPADPTTHRVDRLVEDVESFRVHLGLDRMDLLAHSAGAVLATLYAAVYPHRLSTLMLITPALDAVNVFGAEDDLAAALRRQADQLWYPDALSALQKIMTGDRSIEAFKASRPFYYGRWDAPAQAHAAVGIAERHRAAREGYFADITFDAPATTAALQKMTGPVLLYAGELDPMVPPTLLRQAAPLFHDATVVVQPNAAHFPWVDDPAAFAAAITAFLD